MIPPARPILGAEEQRAVLDVLASGMLAQGPKVKQFEENFAEFIGAKHAIATSSGTASLHAALIGAGIKPGDEVITTPFTFIATASAIRFCGAKPVFVDIKEDFNIDTELITDAISQKTKAIIPVHLYGNPCDIEKIMDIAKDNSLSVIEDACQAHGAAVAGRKVGSFGTGCFSFYPTKNMTTIEGGIITTNDDKLAQKARMFRQHGSRERYVHEMIGHNFRMSDVSAAIGLEQLKRLPYLNTRRVNNATYMNRNLDFKGIITPNQRDRTQHVFNQYTVRVTDDFGASRDDVYKALTENSIGASVFYPIPLHKQEPLLSHKSMPVAERLAGEVLSLPIHPSVSHEDIDRIIEVIASCS